MMLSVNQTLLDFERHSRLGPTFVARLLGVAYPTYAQYRNGRRELPLYHQRHIELLYLIPKESLNHVISRHSSPKRH
jgi:hypothetical protein